MENGMRAVLREAGLKMGKVGRQGFAARARDLAVGNVALEVVVGPLLSIIETIPRSPSARPSTTLRALPDRGMSASMSA
jgi:hypothetical protein